MKAQGTRKPCKLDSISNLADLVRFMQRGDDRSSLADATELGSATATPELPQFQRPALLARVGTRARSFWRRRPRKAVGRRGAANRARKRPFSPVRFRHVHDPVWSWTRAPRASPGTNWAGPPAACNHCYYDSFIPWQATEASVTVGPRQRPAGRLLYGLPRPYSDALWFIHPVAGESRPEAEARRAPSPAGGPALQRCGRVGRRRGPRSLEAGPETSLGDGNSDHHVF
jgi:hypothetical protein